MHVCIQSVFAREVKKNETEVKFARGSRGQTQVKSGGSDNHLSPSDRKYEVWLPDTLTGRPELSVAAKDIC